MKHAFYLIIFSLLMVSCQQEDLSTQDDIQWQEKVNKVGTSVMPNRGICPDCPNMIMNGSFEETANPIPYQGYILLSYQNAVPNWYSASWTPEVFEALNGCSLSLPTTTVDGLNALTFWGSRKGLINVGTGLELHELPYQNISIRNDHDLNYCLTLSHKRGQGGNWLKGTPLSDLEVYTTTGLTPIVVANSNIEEELDEFNAEMIASTSSGPNWETETFSFQPEKANEQIVFICYGAGVDPDEYYGISILDQIELTCQTNALIGVSYIDNPDGTTTLSPVWDGLPNDVTIITYDWRNLNGTPDGLGNFITTFPHGTGAGQEVCLSIIDSRGCCATICETLPSLCPIEFTVKANDIYYSNENEGVYSNKEMTVLSVTTCDDVYELWGVEDIPYIPGTCLENIHYEQSALINCGEDPFGSIDNCDPNSLLVLGQTALSAICPDAILTADDNYKTWTITLPPDNSCSITTLVLNGYNTTYDASCTGLSNVTGNTNDSDDCVCDL